MSDVYKPNHHDRNFDRNRSDNLAEYESNRSDNLAEYEKDHHFNREHFSERAAEPGLVFLRCLGLIMGTTGAVTVFLARYVWH